MDGQAEGLQKEKGNNGLGESDLVQDFCPDNLYCWKTKICKMKGKH